MSIHWFVIISPTQGFPMLPFLSALSLYFTSTISSCVKRYLLHSSFQYQWCWELTHPNHARYVTFDD
ncbi:hypothetical protein Pyn_01428 [Prunus yedoensis var. nudiflora]|uniref:Uncharacterized protein n=1 Tax=Prunus yedoensis var. nudiflora TaxID=2094558 RepID=A0A314ZN29_PRUYE|nr:hypothetical protein Pyn_01428 [Prunus yedoensis var. nudiflora]